MSTNPQLIAQLTLERLARRPLPWVSLRACKGEDAPDMMAITESEAAERCSRCQVREQCIEAAMDEDAPVAAGIRGGQMMQPSLRRTRIPR